jgi:hypothetical protein
MSGCQPQRGEVPELPREVLVDQQQMHGQDPMPIDLISCF